LRSAIDFEEEPSSFCGEVDEFFVEPEGFLTMIFFIWDNLLEISCRVRIHMIQNQLLFIITILPTTLNINKYPSPHLLRCHDDLVLHDAAVEEISLYLRHPTGGLAGGETWEGPG
jgi:hypothetical protein